MSADELRERGPRAGLRSFAQSDGTLPYLLKLREQRSACDERARPRARVTRTRRPSRPTWVRPSPSRRASTIATRLRVRSIAWRAGS